MKRDKLDTLLKQKLGDMPIVPPEGMWDRINQSIEAAGLRSDTEVPGAQTHGDRRLRRIPSWTYTVAACFMAVAVAVSLWNVDSEPLATAEKRIAANVIAPIIGPETSAVTESDTSDAIAEAAKEAAAGSSKVSPASRHATSPAHIATTSRPSSSNTPPITVEDIEGSDNSDVDANAQENITQERSSAREQPGRATRPRTSQSQTASRRQNESFADASRKQNESFADASRRQNESLAVAGRTAPLTPANRNSPADHHAGSITTSVYASNFGGLDTTPGMHSDIAQFSGLRIVENEVRDNAITSSSVDVKMKHKMPLTVGANVSFGVAKNLSVETGLLYSYMSSEAEASANWDYECDQKLHYVGIPLALRYDFFDNKFLKTYTTVGGTIEKCVSAKLTETVYSGLQGSRPATIDLDRGGVQLSANAGVGVHFKIDRLLGLYFEPGIGYYFDSDNQPASYRTDHPLNFTVRAGLRLALN